MGLYSYLRNGVRHIFSAKVNPDKTRVYPFSSIRQDARHASRQYMTRSGIMQTMPARFVGIITPIEYGARREVHNVVL